MWKMDNLGLSDPQAGNSEFQIQSLVSRPVLVDVESNFRHCSVLMSTADTHREGACQEERSAVQDCMTAQDA